MLATLFDEPFAYRLLVMANFVVLCNLWLVIIFPSGMKAYKRILLVMFIGYALMVACACLLRFMQMDGLLLALLIGHASLLFVFPTTSSASTRPGAWWPSTSSTAGRSSSACC